MDHPEPRSDDKQRPPPIFYVCESLRQSCAHRETLLHHVNRAPLGSEGSRDRDALPIGAPTRRPRHREAWRRARRSPPQLSHRHLDQIAGACPLARRTRIDCEEAALLARPARPCHAHSIVRSQHPSVPALRPLNVNDGETSSGRQMFRILYTASFLYCCGFVRGARRRATYPPVRAWPPLQAGRRPDLAGLLCKQDTRASVRSLQPASAARGADSEAEAGII